MLISSASHVAYCRVLSFTGAKSEAAPLMLTARVCQGFVDCQGLSGLSVNATSDSICLLNEQPINYLLMPTGQLRQLYIALRCCTHKLLRLLLHLVFVLTVGVDRQGLSACLGQSSL